MGATDLETFDHSVELAHKWVNELNVALNWNDRRRSWRLLRAVLQTLRDCLPVAECANFASQLPLVLRGVYYEHWRPAAQNAGSWERDRFFAQVQEQFARDPVEDVGDAIEIVFGLFECRISKGEIRHIVACLPPDMHSLWPLQD